ncbi:HGGxSTG domain-containing protein [Flaviflagellibacter deserti]|uniref:HGGxSTG domain-containing protein n=1 Tax=Flaviflagellibacter deserti TaxID=2267266 RepID=A0ABV9Z5Q8_9HYPH
MCTCTMEDRQSLATSKIGEGALTEGATNPVQASRPKHWPMFQACRCGAKTRAGTPCQSPAVRGKARCRMHGGARGSGAPKGERNGSYRHGFHTREAFAERRLVAKWLRGIGRL